MKSSRRNARELALRALYAFELSGNPVPTIVQEQIYQRSTSKEVIEFAERVFSMVVDHECACDEILRNKIANWDFGRVAMIDRLLLRIAICEFIYFDDIPPKVTIDEAIEIAKKYSTENSGRFINGILDAILADLKQTNFLHKSGRGLIDSSQASDA